MVIFATFCEMVFWVKALHIQYICRDIDFVFTVRRELRDAIQTRKMPTQNNKIISIQIIFSHTESSTAIQNII